MQRLQTISCSLILAAALAGCGGGDGAGDGGMDAGPDGGAGALALATYNTALAVGYVDYAPARLPLIADAVAALDADVVCLQEVWRPEDADAIVAAAAAAFPYAYVELTAEDPADGGVDGGGVDGGAGPACDAEETTSLGGCALEYCGDVAPENLASCVLASCGEEFAAVSPDCSNCLIANLGAPIEEILEICSGGGGGAMAWGGRNGLVLLSKLPITAQEYLLLDSFLLRRVVLHARIDAGAAGEVDVFCTHLTANLESPAYTGDYGSWEAERAAQIAALLPWIDEVKGAAGRVTLLGDTNCGPDTANVDAEWPEDYAALTAGGLADPYVDAPDHACTWCLDNPLVGADTGGANSIIDHILVQGWPAGATWSAARILDGEITVDDDGTPVTTRLSDHYGVRAEITLP